MMSDFEERPPGTAVRLDIYSHHVKVTGYGRLVKEALLKFCKPMAQKGLIKKGRYFIKAMLRVFVGVTLDREEFNFHINQLDALLMHLSCFGYSKDQLWIVEHKLYTPTRVEYTYIDERTPREEQGSIIDYVLADGITKVVTLDPGRGKTFIGLCTIRDLEVRTFFCIKPKYMEKWVNDVNEAFSLDPGELMVVSGSASLKKLMNLAESGELKAKIIICSNSTFQIYLKSYELYRDNIARAGYPFTPHEFYEKMDIGYRIIDEVHEFIHLNYRQDMYSHVPKTLSLSGTLESNDSFITKIYGIMFPFIDRYINGPRKIYVSAEALMYGFPNADNRIKYINRGMNSYSHVKYEQAIMKDKLLYKSYLDMVCDIVDKRFIEEMKSGQKMVVYFSTIDMCTLVSAELQRRHPKVNVTRYVGADDYNEMLKSELMVTTLKSLGTAIDVPGLKVVLLTDAIDSRHSNLQCMGRLRELVDWPDETPEFLFLVARDVEKHVTYYENKKDMFEGRVKRFITTHTGYSL